MNLNLKEKLQLQDVDFAHPFFAQDRAGAGLNYEADGWAEMAKAIENAQKIVAFLNTGYHDKATVLAILSALFGYELKNAWIMPPFYTDFGRGTKIAEGVFVNTACTFMDRGGIEIGEGTFIAPKVNIVTIGHDLNPFLRTTTFCKPVKIGKRVWIGINSTICPGVIVGDNAVIGANSTVTKNVPKNAIVAGSPAKIIRYLSDEELRQNGDFPR